MKPNPRPTRARALTREAVNSASNRTLVGEESRYPSLVLVASTSNKGAVVDETVLCEAAAVSNPSTARMVVPPHLGGVTLGLECSEESFLRPKNLDGGGWVFCQVGERTAGEDEMISGWNRLASPTPPPLTHD